MKRRVSLVGLAVAAGILMALPSFSAADFVGDVVGQVGSSAPSAPSQPPSNSKPRSGFPGNTSNPYVPPQHGTNPHAQGTAAVIDVNPASSKGALGSDPAGGNPQGSGEDIVVGRARGEQCGSTPSTPCTSSESGKYHGHVTAVALFGNELIGIDTKEGDPTKRGPLDPLQTQLLDQICTGSNGALCITVLTMASKTDSSGSTNHFQAASAHLGDKTGANQINAGAVSSNGNISSTSTCQTSHSDSNVANADVGGPTGGGQLTADALRSTSDSQACNDGTSSQSNTSKNVLASLNGNIIGACTNSPPGAPNQIAPFPANPLLTLVCAADESNDTQAVAPQGAREALTAFVLSDLTSMTAAKLTTAASETRAAAPPLGPPSCVGDNCNPPPIVCTTTVTTNCTPPHDKKKKKSNGTDRNSAAGSARAGAGGTLPFTGTDLVLIAMAGLGLLGTGLATKAALAARRSS